MSRARRIPISRVDRLWLGSSVITAVGPLLVPPREQVVEAFVTLASAGPGSRIGLRFDPRSQRRWLYRTDDLPQWADSCVVDLPPGSDGDLDALMSRLADDRPVRIYLADRHVLVHVNHALGDSRLALALPSVLVALAHGADLPVWATTEVDRYPLRSAARHTFGRRADVARLIGEWRSARSAAAAQAERPAAPFVPEPAAINETGDADTTRAVRRWTAEHLPGAAHFAVVLAAVHRSFEEHGIACAPGVHMVFDLHRYLPKNAHTTGNFVGGVDLAADLADPVALTALVTRTAKSGRPLASVAAAVTLSTVLRRQQPGPQQVAVAPPARLALSYIGAKTLDETLPWTSGPGERAYASRVDPAGPTAVTLLAALVDGRLLLGASFHSSVFDPTTLREALRAVHREPIGLLARATGQQP